MLDFLRNPWVVIGIIAVVLIGGSIWHSSLQAKSADADVVVQTHIKGNPEATVTLVEYSDFQCPACQQMAPIIEAMLKDYGDQVRFEYRHFPLIQIHPNAEAAARAAEAAGQQGKFFAYHDALFANQKEWGAAAIPGAYFIKYAEQLNLDMTLFKRQQKSSLLKQKVRDDLETAQELRLTGTPTLFLNGEKMDFQTYQDFSDQIRTALGIEVEAEVAPAEPTIEFSF